jgi:hypothetical protein
MMKKSMLSAAASSQTANTAVAPDNNFGDACAVRPYLHDLELAIQQLEAKFHNSDSASCPGSYLQDSTGAITSGMRDGSAHVLRCLKVWYDLPSEVFFTAVSSIDRFLAKMKVNLLS